MEISALESVSEKLPGKITTQGIPLNFSKNKEFVQKKLDMIVFIDTSWEYINQRPRKIAEQLAKYQQILFIEKPFIDENIEKEHYKIVKTIDNLIVIKPILRDLNDLAKVIKLITKSETIPVGWFSSAFYYPIINKIKFKKIIYDIESEVVSNSDFEKKNEKRLLKKSDIIITGSKAEFEEKSQFLKNVHWIPSPVDDIFYMNGKKSVSAPEPLINPERPIIGYCGLIDNRIDFKFLEKAAVNMPFATFVLIGPMLNSKREKLPEISNICYFNLSKYDAIPSYLKAIDIAMVPIDVEQNNNFVSSSIVLKYMATNKPIISTPVYDIVRDFHHCIDIVSSVDDFCLAASRKFILNKEENEERWFCYNKILNRSSWKETADKIQHLIACDSDF